MSKTASKMIELAQSWVGIKEGSSGHKEILAIYNSQKHLPRGYKMTTRDAWCAATTTALAVKLGYTDIVPCECSCNQLIAIAKKMGIWIEDESITPTPGMLCLYDWNDNGRGDNKGEVEHVGIVETVGGGKFVVIEGNADTNRDGKDGVERRTLSVNGRYLRGFIAPKYDAEPVAPIKPTEEYSQEQFIRDVQAATGAAVDGIAGPETLSKTPTLSASKNRKHAAVKAVQKRLYAMGYTAVGEADGIAGPKFTKAVKEFQYDYRCWVDGEITARNKTWRRLLDME